MTYVANIANIVHVAYVAIIASHGQHLLCTMCATCVTRTLLVRYAWLVWPGGHVQHGVSMEREGQGGKNLPLPLQSLRIKVKEGSGGF